MTFTILLSETVEIPDDRIPALYAAVNKRFAVRDGALVYAEDLICQAIIEGDIPQFEDEWRAEDTEPYDLAAWKEF